MLCSTRTLVLTAGHVQRALKIYQTETEHPSSHKQSVNETAQIKTHHPICTQDVQFFSVAVSLETDITVHTPVVTPTR